MHLKIRDFQKALKSIFLIDFMLQNNEYFESFIFRLLQIIIMHSKNIFHSSRKMRGVSPLVASVLLIAIVITISMIIMGWLSTLTKTTTSTVTNKTQEGINCASASISIEDVYIIGTSSANVVVKNTGFTNGLNISGTLLNITGYNFTATQPASLLNKGNVFTLNFPSVSIATCPNSFSRVIVTTDCGGVIDTFTNAPKCA